MTTNGRFEQIKEVFNIDDEFINDIEEPESEEIDSEEKLHEAMELADTLNKRLTTANDTDKHDAEMDEISELAVQGFKDLKDLGMDVEIRHAGEIFTSAAQFLKIGLDARNSKVDKKLKMLKLQLDKLRLDRSMPQEEAKSIDGNVNLIDRNELLKTIKEVRKEKDSKADE